MIPSITPPTDNLYKFISLFGLAIFLFSAYNMSIVYDKSGENKIEIEELKVTVQKKLYLNNQEVSENLVSDSTASHFRPAQLAKLNDELAKVEEAVAASELSPVDKIDLQGEISKLNVSLDALRLKFWSCTGFMLLGIGVMVFGFIRWQKREQTLRDRLLTIEYEIKERERKRKKIKRHTQISLEAGKVLEEEKLMQE